MKLRDKLPDFPGNAKWLNGRVEKQELHGVPLLLHFWSAECCVNEHLLPLISTWNQQYRNAKLLQVVGVHVARTAMERNRERIVQNMTTYGITYPVFLDDEGITITNYGIKNIPVAYLFDCNLHLRHIQAGTQGVKLLERRLRTIIGID